MGVTEPRRAPRGCSRHRGAHTCTLPALMSHGAFSGLRLSLQQAIHHHPGWKGSCPCHLLLLLSLLLLQFLHSWLFFEPTVSHLQVMGMQPGRKVQGITETWIVCQHVAPWWLPRLCSYTKKPLYACVSFKIIR